MDVKKNLGADWMHVTQVQSQAAGCRLQPGHYSSLTAPNLQNTANQDRNAQCGNQHHSRELLMMGIVMPETCRAYTKHNKIISGIQLVFLFFSYHNDARSNKHQVGRSQVSLMASCKYAYLALHCSDPAVLPVMNQNSMNWKQIPNALTIKYA